MAGSVFKEAFDRSVGNSVTFVRKHYSRAFAEQVVDQLQAFSARPDEDTSQKTIDAFTRKIADETVSSTVNLHLGIALGKALKPG
ncbi:MAG TPA: hypothetical protein VL625_01445 [Patescibacteria group bacterium]|nr:hypothetical protein [Patescibacteria group bacterium]